jgi:hypothetical protein
MKGRDSKGSLRGKLWRLISSLVRKLKVKCEIKTCRPEGRSKSNVFTVHLVHLSHANSSRFHRIQFCLTNERLVLKQ